MAATGTGFRYAGANSDDVSNNSGWIFSACADCFNQPAAPAPALDPGSITQVLAGEQANLVLQNVPQDKEVVWFNEDQTQELYADIANQFQPVINAGTVFYAALRDVNTGCVSEVLAVPVSILAEYTITASAGYCTGEPGPLIGLDNSYQGYSYQLQTSGGSNLGAPVAGTGFPITFGSYPNGDYQVVVTGPGPTQTITGTVNGTPGNCGISVPNFCFCNATDGRAPVTVKMSAPSGQNWTVKVVMGLYLTSSPPAPAAPTPMPVGTALTDIGGNMYTLDGIRLTTKGFWVQVTNGSSDFDIMVGNASW
ncbi:MAG: hypothetical protein IPM81_16070 [Saprospirales bacterium]|nr:hypothetical protein [Saprospirales bacterium]